MKGNNVSPRNKNARRFQKIQKPVAGTLLVSLSLGQPGLILAQVPATPPPGLPAPAAPVPALPFTPRPAPVVPPAAPAGAPAMPAAAPASVPVAAPAPAAAPEAAPAAAIPAVAPPAATPIPTSAPTPFRPRPPILPSALTGAAPAENQPAAGAGAATPAAAKGPSTLTTDLPPKAAGQMVALKYKDTPLDLILDNVAEWTGRMLIKAPGLNASITLMSADKIPITDALEAIETVLAMNNVGFVKMGTKFLKIVPIANIQPEGTRINFGELDKLYPEADQLVSQVIPLKYMDPTEATPAIQPLIHGYGKIQAFERTNSLLITDTGSNINRIMEVLAYIDQPVESKVETRIYEIKYAKASDIASRLNELIADTQGKEEKPRIENAPAAPAAPAIPTPPGVIRAPRPAGTAQVSSSGESAAEAAERGVIRGKVKIVSDERMNMLFIISRSENFVFFDKIITVLDRATDPEITVRVAQLEFAKAEDIASILNEFIGAAKEESTQSGASGQNRTAPAGTAAGDARSLAIRDYIASRTQQASDAAAAARARLAPVTAADKDVIGRLSPTTRILAYKPTNSLMLMGRRSDLEALSQLIAKLDVMLAQVLIEAVIIEVNLGNDVSYGVDWLQRSMTAYDTTKAGPNGGLSVSEPVFSFGGGTAFGGGGFRDGAQVDRSSPLGSGLTYYTTIYGLNLDAVIKMAKSSRDARILQTPVVLTTDNKEASIKVGESRPIVNANIVQTTGQNTQNYEYKDIGIELKVTPRINPRGVVGMEVKQTADNVGGFEVVNGANVPIITRREMSADISVRHNQTIILGGLTSSDKTKSRSGIPILSDIPILGALFRTDSLKDTRTELLVLLTPYVLKSPEEAREETARLHIESASSKTRWHTGWSDSELPRMSEDDMQAMLDRRKTRLLKMEEDEKNGMNVRVSTNAIEDDAQPDAKKPADQATPDEKSAPETPSGTETPAPEKDRPAAGPPAAAPEKPAAPAVVDPNTPVPLGK